MALIKRTIFAAGAAHIDRRGQATGPFRPAASNPGTVTETVGGAMFNAALALRAFGAKVDLATARGGDGMAKTVAKAVEVAGITDLAITWLDRTTASYTAILDDKGELVAGIADMEIYDLLVGRIFERRHLREIMASADAVLLDANLPASGIDGLIDAFAGRPVAAIGVSPAKVMRLSSRLAGLSILFLSRAEAAALVEASAATGVAMLARLLSEAGAVRAVITDGAADVAILDHGNILLQAPPAVARLRDVTGAGDTLAAVATLSFVDGRPLIEGVQLGMAAASRKIASDNAGSNDAARLIETVAAGMAPPRAIDEI